MNLTVVTALLALFSVTLAVATHFLVGQAKATSRGIEKIDSVPVDSAQGLRVSAITDRDVMLIGGVNYEVLLRAYVEGVAARNEALKQFRFQYHFADSLIEESAAQTNQFLEVEIETLKHAVDLAQYREAV